MYASVRSPFFTVLIIVHTSIKCSFILYTSWRAKISSQKFGSQMHKLANVVNEHWCYQTVNRWSSILANDHLKLTSSGFFELNMATLYSVGETTQASERTNHSDVSLQMTASITSYLLILIQFNVASQLNVKATNTTMPSTTSTN